MQIPQQIDALLAMQAVMEDAQVLTSALVASLGTIDQTLPVMSVSTGALMDLWRTLPLRSVGVVPPVSPVKAPSTHAHLVMREGYSIRIPVCRTVQLEPLSSRDSVSLVCPHIAVCAQPPSALYAHQITICTRARA